MNNKLITIIKKHWGKIITLLVIGTPIIMLLGYFLPIIGYSTIQELSYDKKLIEDSPYLGREIKIAPFAILAKMKKYNGWTDEYLHIFSRVPRYMQGAEVEWTKKLDGYVTLKVIEVRYKTYEIESKYTICILENSKNPKEIVSERCDDLNDIEKVTKLFQDGEEEIRKSGRVQVSIEKIHDQTNLKLISDDNVIQVFELYSTEELLSLLSYSSYAHDSYSFLGDNKPTVVRK